MSSIIAFRPRRKAESKPKPGVAGDATVIIFPGVRYERSPAAEKNAAPWIQPAHRTPFLPAPLQN